MTLVHKTTPGTTLQNWAGEGAMRLFPGPASSTVVWKLLLPKLTPECVFSAVPTSARLDSGHSACVLTYFASKLK